MLYIISTPIGNIEDISFRAVRILKEADIILAEDTRRTGLLLTKFNIKNRMMSFNDHNKERRTQEIIDKIKGNRVAIVSDNGTPGISDPGFYLVRACIKNGIKVTGVPGASAMINALVCSGLPTDRFCFLGFLSKKEKEKRELFEDIKMTTIVYESPHRIIKTLELMKDTIPHYNVAICREMTKKFEEFIRGKVIEVYEKIKDKPVKGEIVLIISKPKSL